MIAQTAWSSEPLLLPSDHHYRLVYETELASVGSVLEFDALDLMHALEFILNEEIKASVHVWQDDRYVCSIGRQLPSVR